MLQRVRFKALLRQALTSSVALHLKYIHYGNVPHVCINAAGGWLKCSADIVPPGYAQPLTIASAKCTT